MKNYDETGESPYINEQKLDRAVEKLEEFLLSELDVKSYSELVLLTETLKGIWQRDDVHQDIAEGVHLQYQDEE